MDYLTLLKYLSTLNISEREVADYASKCMNFEPDLSSAFESFVKTGEIPHIEISKITLDEIIRKQKCSVIEAFIEMNKLASDQKYAEAYKNISFKVR